MSVLAIRSGARCTSDDALEETTALRLWRDVWPDLPAHEVPVGSIPDGIHVPSWTCADLSALFSRYLGPRWRESIDDPALWARIHEVPDAELWDAHVHRRHRLIALARTASADPNALDARALTIGASADDAALLLSDSERLVRFLFDAERPAQLVIAGAPSPVDPRLRGRLVVVDDRDIALARAHASGVDAWLTSRRSHEAAASTRAHRAAANGALCLGVHRRFRVGSTEGPLVALDEKEEETERLWVALERRVAPLFFERDAGSGLPLRWIARMKASIAKLVPTLNGERTAKEYASQHYHAAMARARLLASNDFAAARELVDWKRR
jgi:starch phosphorylase